jgi:hypothetical protein
MSRISWLAIGAVLAAGLVGCGNQEEVGLGPAPSDQSDSNFSQSQQGGPEVAVHQFLEAVRTGDEEKTAAMLTKLARQKTAEQNIEVAPPGSGTARFEVGQVQHVGQDGARVTTIWSDLDENSQRRSDQILWLLRREPGGWRIAGMAAAVFEDADPLVLNFEDPEDMLRQQLWVQEEIQRRAQQAQNPESPELQTAEQPDSPVRH